MADQPSAISTYLPWLQPELVRTAASAPATDGRLALGVRVEISVDASEKVAATSDAVQILLSGPGDVNGVDARQVIRTDPPPLTTDFEPNYFPVVEFDRPDLVWLFTPELADKDRLRPWLCLIAVEKRDEVELGYVQGQPLPVLTIKKDAYLELPDLNEGWAWAHSQIAGVGGTTDAEIKQNIEAALNSQSDHTLSRLMCPRHLQKRTAYIACVVPTYCGGVQAGLGEPVTRATALTPAWTLGANSPPDIRLPVYYHWEFATGGAGDFESLVWQLERRSLTFAEVGRRKLDISHAGNDLPASPPVDLEGALALSATSGDAPTGPSQAYQERLQMLLNGTAPGSSHVPIVQPPLYGQWHAAQRSIPDVISTTQTRDRPWLRALNLDPRYRVAAGLGAQVVREQQEQLMASAWDQVGSIERANQVLRQAQLARAASTTIHQVRLANLDAATFLMVSAPMHARVKYANAGQELTARGHVQASRLPRAAVSAQFRRALRPRGVFARRFGLNAAAARADVIKNLNEQQIAARPAEWLKPNGMFNLEGRLERNMCGVDAKKLALDLVNQWTPEKLYQYIKQVSAETDKLTGAFPQLKEVEKSLSNAKNWLDGFTAEPSNLFLYQSALMQIAEARRLALRLRNQSSSPKIKQLVDLMNQSPTNDELRGLLFGLSVLDHLRSVEPCDNPTVTPPPALDIEQLKTNVLAKIDPRKTIPARIGTLVHAPGWQAIDLDFVLAAPEFPAPMYKSLAALSQDWLLPGLEHLPSNVIALLESNSSFIESFMVGLNHEMSRELLWRGYPTDQRGTYFHNFWDSAGHVPAPQKPSDAWDIPAIHEWREGQLGSQFGKGAKPIVLLVRGDLVRRYPRADIFMVRAEWKNNLHSPIQVTNEQDTAQIQYPIFRGDLPPDISFLGFQLTSKEAVGDANPNNNKPGWFVVIQQQPTEPRYGLDASKANTDSKNWTWRDLSWEHVKPSGINQYIQISAGLESTFPASAQKGPGGESWLWADQAGPPEKHSDSAQIASITLQGPVRVYIHASDLFPDRTL